MATASHLTARRILSAPSNPLLRNALIRQASPLRNQRSHPLTCSSSFKRFASSEPNPSEKPAPNPSATSTIPSSTTPTSTTPPTPAPSSSSSSSYSSSSSSSGSSSSGGSSTVKTALYAASLTVTAGAIWLYTTDTRAFFHQYLVPPVLRWVYPDAEEAHNVAVSAMKLLYGFNLHPRDRTEFKCDPSNNALSVSVFGQDLNNPIGISAGLDKHADIPNPLFSLGAAVVEVGGCTPLAQPGNPRPRMFRVPGLDGLINRYGLNSRGADNMAMQLRERLRRFAKSVGLSEDAILSGEAGIPAGSLSPGRMLLVQVAKNKDTDGADVAAVQRDYVYCVQRLARYADVLVVNVSSPNTPGLRDLQAVEPLTRILSAVVEEARRADGRQGQKPRVMVKVSPDEDEASQMEGIVQAVYASGVDGVIVGNTTNRRTGLIPNGRKLTRGEVQTMTETGGYSGPMMFNRTADLVGRYRKMLDNWGLLQQQATTTVTDGVSGLATAAKDAAMAVDEEAVDASIAAIDGTVTGMANDSSPIGTNKARDQEKQLLKEQMHQSTTATPPEQKVIFATGGITNGQQALEVLNAGASVAMVYTGMVYGGAGTVTRIKGEMKNELQQQQQQKKN